MSRRSQDIPIRPRYGIPDESTETEDQEQMEPNVPILANKPRRASNSMASSYSEIPFLAQYPGAVPEYELNDVTPTGTKPPCVTADDSLEEEDSGEDNSKGSSSCEASKTPKRPNSLQCDSSFPYELEGAGSTESEMRHFVADNLEEKLRTDSPLNKKDPFGSYTSHNSTPSTSTGMLTRHFFQSQQPPQIDPNVLNDIEIEAQYLAAAVDNLTENLCNLLHSISAITADNVDVHKNAVNKLTDSMDTNIKCMYTIMAKAEEITKSMKPTEHRDIKHLVDVLDSAM